MNLKNLSDQELLANLKALAGQERELLTEILHHLREVEHRRLHSDLKYSSLLEYAVGELCYSEDAASRRISAMRLIRDLPDVEEKIASGDLTLSNVLLVQTLFFKEKKAGREMGNEAKTKVIEMVCRKPGREARKVVAAINPEMKKPAITFQMIEDDSLREKLLTLRGKYAHKSPNMTLTELLHKLCDDALEEKVPAKPRQDSLAEIYREVRRRAANRCELCNSVHALEVDHIKPRSQGGGSTLENLRLLCRACNQRAAIEKIGSETMSRYLKCSMRTG